jgi:hypothetical protein
MPDRHKVKPKAVRMPDGLLARVETAAPESGLSVNAFIVAAIEEKLERRASGSTIRHALTCKCAVCKPATGGKR